jgi:hypothetical protein
MMIEVIEVNAFGHGYYVVHQDDGTSFGQHFHDLPVEDAAAFDAALADHVDHAVLRNTAVSAKTIDAQVLSRIGVKQHGPVKRV